METLTKLLIGLMLVIIFALGIIFLKGFQNPENKTEIIGPNSKTDTTIIRIDYHTPGNPKNTWNPTFVIQYPKAKNDTNIRFVLSDSLLSVVDSLNGVIKTYNLAFLSNSPDNYKLLNLKIKLDSLKLDVLSPNGSIKSEGYLIDLKKYQYFYDTHLSYEKIKQNKPPTKDNLHLDLFGGYDFLTKSPNVSLRPNFNYKRVLIYSELKTQIQDKPTLNLELGAGIRLK